MLQVIFHDQDLIVVNKPSGLLSIRDGYNPDLPTVKSELEETYGPCWIVHRLDKETSGIMIFARNRKTHRILNMDFENRKIRKYYHAIVIGSPELKEISLSFPLRINGDRNHRTIIDFEQGKPSQTNIRILEKKEKFCLLEACPFSGYTHQIRAHLAFFGLPILGDVLYGKKENINIDFSSFISRTALHAFQIEFVHPVSGVHSIYTASYPEDFANVLSLL